ncbi:MAG: hypothetical protein HY684_05155 [Chloroflexi bacterium]|nr:hypothetical protein [Chloroflexota bacterium]
MWTILHGMAFGAVFLVAFAGAWAGLWSYRSGLITLEGARERLKRLVGGLWVMAGLAWATVITGTYIVYVWYRDPSKTSPRSILRADPKTIEWHSFGMEWKEHVAWVAPILLTVVAFVVGYYGPRLIHQERIRRGAIAFLIIGFVVAAVAAALGAFINKVAAVR